VDANPESPGGQGEGADSGELTRGDLDLIRQAARNDWPVPAATRAKIVQRLVSYLDAECEEGSTAPDRVVLGAARALAAFCGLGLKQQQLDLMRERLEGKKSEVSLADLVGDAESRAEARKLERASEQLQPGG
jgi:hypothetical protein